MERPGYDSLVRKVLYLFSTFNPFKKKIEEDIATIQEDLTDLTDGKVDGPASSIDNALARFDGTTGKVVQNSIGKIDDDGNLSEIKDTSTETITIDSAVQMSYDSVNQSLKFNFL